MSKQRNEVMAAEQERPQRPRNSNLQLQGLNNKCDNRGLFISLSLKPFLVALHGDDGGGRLVKAGQTALDSL